MSETKREYAPNYHNPPLHTRFKKGLSGNPRGRPKRDLPGLLVAALNEPVFVTVNGRRRKITKRETVIHQLVNKSTSADLRATKMLMDMMKDAERKAGIAESPATPPEAPRLGPADKELIKNLVERIRQDILAQIDAQKAQASGEGRGCDRRCRRSHAGKENAFMKRDDPLKELHELRRRNATPMRLIECLMRWFLSIPG
jgi:hypothetical protein